jgi:hypothetical protein
MSYRIQIELDEREPLQNKVRLHGKLLRHFQRRKLDADAKGKTRWTWEFQSGRSGFVIVWARSSHPVKADRLRFQSERFMGMIVLKFSADDVEKGGYHLVTGDWEAIEDQILERESVA